MSTSEPPVPPTVPPTVADAAAEAPAGPDSTWTDEFVGVTPVAPARADGDEPIDPNAPTPQAVPVERTRPEVDDLDELLEEPDVATVEGSPGPTAPPPPPPGDDGPPDPLARETSADPAPH